MRTPFSLNNTCSSSCENRLSPNVIKPLWITNSATQCCVCLFQNYLVYFIAQMQCKLSMESWCWKVHDDVDRESRRKQSWKLNLLKLSFVFWAQWLNHIFGECLLSVCDSINRVFRNQNKLSQMTFVSLLLSAVVDAVDHGPLYILHLSLKLLSYCLIFVFLLFYLVCLNSILYEINLSLSVKLRDV